MGFLFVIASLLYVIWPRASAAIGLAVLVNGCAVGTANNFLSMVVAFGRYCARGAKGAWTNPGWKDTCAGWETTYRNRYRCVRDIESAVRAATYETERIVAEYRQSGDAEGVARWEKILEDEKDLYRNCPDVLAEKIGDLAYSHELYWTVRSLGWARVVAGTLVAVGMGAIIV